ncbi:MAG: DUF1552 domain-containing protein, partial [Blastocatellia bacterium]
MITRKAMSRRTILKGMGTAIALPFLDAMTPALAYSKTGSKIPGETPVRMMFVYVPNGIMMQHWNPTYEGKLQELPRVLKPLESLKDDIMLLSNLTNNAGRAWLDGAGDHGRCCGSYLTSVHVRKTKSDILSGT